MIPVDEVNMGSPPLSTLKVNKFSPVWKAGDYSRAPPQYLPAFTHCSLSLRMGRGFPAHAPILVLWAEGARGADAAPCLYCAWELHKVPYL